MKTATKSGTRTKTAVKPAKKASKAATAVKKAVKKRPAAVKTAADADEPKRVIVPLAEVEALAAKAVKMIKAKRSASPEKKAVKLAEVEEILERARRDGGVPKGGVFDLKYPFGLDFIYIDWKAVLG